MSNLTQLENLIVKNVADELKLKELTKNDQQYVVSLFRSMDKSVFKGVKYSDIGRILGKIFGEKILEKKESESFDITEYQKNTIGTTDEDPGVYGNYSTEETQLIKPEQAEKSVDVVDFLGIDDITKLKMLFNPESLYVHYYLVLDSNYRDTTNEISTNITKFTWKYAPTQSTGTGFCNSVGVIRDIIGMRMYQPRVPYLAGMNTDAKRVSVLIEEFSSQAFIAENGRRFHFLLRPNFITGQTDIELSTEDYNDGIFNFRTPITKVDSYTLSFGDPLNILSFSTPFNRFIIPFEMVCLKSDK